MTTATTLGTIQHWVGGRPWTGAGQGDPAADTGRFGEVHNPATGEVSARVAYASTHDVDAAVERATEAFRSWGRSSLGQRTQILFALRERLERAKDELARLVTLEHGKVLADAAGEVKRAQEVVEFACGIPQLLKGRYSQGVSSQIDVYSMREPLGVVAGITPFNFPVMVPLWMAPIAIACGNAFILKPSERDPSAPSFLGQLFGDAGLPAGVFNVLHGDREAVDALLHHPGIAAVSFVGSTPVARHVYETAAAQGKRVQALGGAKNHMVVLPDADLDLAADAAVSAGYGSAGERCMAISVVVAVEPIGDALVEKIRERTERLTVGSGLDRNAEMGPLVTAGHLRRVVGYVEEGEREGARLVVDGRQRRMPERGFFLGPCLFDRVEPAMSIYRDEIFGPVLSVVRTPSYEQAVELINRNPYGNGVAIFTRDGGAARRFQTEVESGMVGINVAIPVPMAYYSFGGWGQSLFGDTHVHGEEGVHFYTRGKVVTARFADPESRGPDLGFPTAR